MNAYARLKRNPRKMCTYKKKGRGVSLVSALYLPAFEWTRGLQQVP